MVAATITAVIRRKRIIVSPIARIPLTLVPYKLAEYKLLCRQTSFSTVAGRGKLLVAPKEMEVLGDTGVIRK
jgi:hypothetical protein